MSEGDDKWGGLKIDFREQRSGISEEIRKLASEISFQFCTLITGDYCIADKIIIERKTLVDFNNSIKDGRIFQQAYRMSQSGKNSVIILEGNLNSLESGLMNRKAVQGALVHLAVFTGIPVIRSANIYETAYLIANIIHQYNKVQLPQLPKILVKKPGIILTKEQRKKLSLIQNLPGIGTKKALTLLRTFRSIDNIIKASVPDLMKVEGIGRKLANGIFTTVHNPF